MTFRKYRLLDYQIEPYQSLEANGIGYLLTIEVWTWWGLKKRIVKRRELLPYYMDAEKFWLPKLCVWMPKEKKKVNPVL